MSASDDILAAFHVKRVPLVICALFSLAGLYFVISSGVAEPSPYRRGTVPPWVAYWGGLFLFGIAGLVFVAMVLRFKPTLFATAQGLWYRPLIGPVWGPVPWCEIVSFAAPSNALRVHLRDAGATLDRLGGHPRIYGTVRHRGAKDYFAIGPMDLHCPARDACAELNALHRALGEN